MTYERDEYMRRQEAEHEMIRMRQPISDGWTAKGRAWLRAGAPSNPETMTMQQAIGYVHWLLESGELAGLDATAKAALTKLIQR